MPQRTLSETQYRRLVADQLAGRGAPINKRQPIPPQSCRPGPGTIFFALQEQLTLGGNSANAVLVDASGNYPDGCSVPSCITVLDKYREFAKPETANASGNLGGSPYGSFGEARIIYDPTVDAANQPAYWITRLEMPPRWIHGHVSDDGAGNITIDVGNGNTSCDGCIGLFANDPSAVPVRNPFHVPTGNCGGCLGNCTGANGSACVTVTAVLTPDEACGAVYVLSALDYPPLPTEGNFPASNSTYVQGFVDACQMWMRVGDCGNTGNGNACAAWSGGLRHGRPVGTARVGTQPQARLRIPGRPGNTAALRLSPPTKKDEG